MSRNVSGKHGGQGAVGSDSRPTARRGDRPDWGGHVGQLEPARFRAPEDVRGTAPPPKVLVVRKRRRGVGRASGSLHRQIESPAPAADARACAFPDQSVKDLVRVLGGPRSYFWRSRPRAIHMKTTPC